MLASISADKTLRTWDLTSMKPLAVRGISCLECWSALALRTCKQLCKRGQRVFSLCVCFFQIISRQQAATGNVELISSLALCPEPPGGMPCPKAFAPLCCSLQLLFPPSPCSQVMPNAHDTPLQCLAFSPERAELATCGMGNKVKIWDVSKPSSIRRVLTLDHAETDADRDEDGSPLRKKSDMQWLTRSDVAGLPSATGIVLETIQNANRDVPEVTQVCAVMCCDALRCDVTFSPFSVLLVFTSETRYC